VQSGSIFTFAHDAEIGIAVVAGIAVLVVNVLALQLGFAVLADHKPSCPVTGCPVLDLLRFTLVVLVFFLVVSHRFSPLFPSLRP